MPCLDICIPRLKQIEPNNNESLTLSKLILFQIPLTNNVISKTIIQEENENKQVDEDLYQIEIPQKISTEVIKTNVPESYTDAIEGVNIKNGTDFELTNEMLSKEVNFRNSKKGKSLITSINFIISNSEDHNRQKNEKYSIIRYNSLYKEEKQEQEVKDDSLSNRNYILKSDEIYWSFI